MSFDCWILYLITFVVTEFIDFLIFDEDQNKLAAMLLNSHRHTTIPIITHAIRSSPGRSLGDWSLLTDFVFFFFLPPFITIGAANCCSGCVICSSAFSIFEVGGGSAGLGDLDCSSSDSESIVAACSNSSIEQHELGDNGTWTCSKVACNSLVGSNRLSQCKCEQRSEFLTKTSDTNEPPTGIRTFFKDP